MSLQVHHKILIIRLSSIGDIVLTSPVIRCLHEQIPNLEIHYLTKKQYLPVLQSDPRIARLHLFKGNYQDLIPRLRAEKFDLIVDLHKNLRSHYIRHKLGVRATSFPKLNLHKWLLTRFHINLLPNVHIVERYFRAVGHLGVTYDGRGLDYFLLDSERVDLDRRFPGAGTPFIAIAIGGRHATKIFPAHRVAELCRLLPLPVILLGGKEDMERGDGIVALTKQGVVNACGKLTLNESASVVEQAACVISNDTGLMHMAAALKRPVVSLWGNTIPGFGMTPFFPAGMEERSVIAEVAGLACRPCSKLGYPVCPKQHFDCMEKIPLEEIAEAVTRLIRLPA